MIIGYSIFAPVSDNVYLKYVNPDGTPVHLINNPVATDPTYDQVMSFVASDTTDMRQYVTGKYVCSNFAEQLHNNAEAAGLRCAWVGIHFVDDTSGHSCNAFNTADRGLIFIDCTGSEHTVYGDSYDTIVEIAAGDSYKPKSINATYDGKYSAFGTVKNYKIFW
jgi:hypothetical protein